jgi:hypothetical protein
MGQVLGTNCHVLHCFIGGGVLKESQSVLEILLMFIFSTTRVIDICYRRTNTSDKSRLNFRKLSTSTVFCCLSWR